MSDNPLLPNPPSSGEVDPEVYEELLTTLATGVRDMMARTKTTRAKLAKAIKKDPEWVNQFLDGFNEDVDLDDVKAIANAMGYKADIQLQPLDPGSGPSYEIRNDGFGETRKDGEIPEPPEEEED